MLLVSTSVKAARIYVGEIDPVGAKRQGELEGKEKCNFQKILVFPNLSIDPESKISSN